jgi:hypothetical protein
MPLGDVLIGDGSSDLYIGDGINSVDIVFDVNGSVRAEAGVTLTLGASGATTAIAGLSLGTETNAVMRNTTTGALSYRTLGSNAFNSTNYVTAVTAGSGLSGGGTGGSLSLSHSDTSTLSGTYGSTADGTKIDSITVDAFGHITAVTTGDVGDILGVTAGTGLSGGGTSGTVTLNVSGLTVAEFNGSAIQTGAEAFVDSDTVLMTAAAVQDKITSYGYTTNTGDITGVTAGSGLSGGGTSGTVTLSHSDTSSQGSVNNSDGTVIQDVTLDTYGHVTALGSVNLDGRYYTETESDARFLGISAKAADSDLLDGIDSSAFLRSNADDTATGKITINDGDADPLRLERSSQVGIFFNDTSNPRYLGSSGGNLYFGTNLNHGSNNRVFHDGYHPNADTLTTARTINGVSFNGSANITVADATKLPLTGGTLSDNLTLYKTSADTNLTIQGHESFDPILTFKSSQGAISTEGAEIWYDNNVGDLHIHTTYPNDAAAIRFHTKTGASKSTSNERMTIAGDGNVGIGTTSPGAKLEISGFSTGAGLKLNYGNSSGTIEAVNFIANGGANGVIGMQMVSAGVGDLWLGGSGGRALTLYRDGNVGIGTTEPGNKLDVNGTGRFTSLLQVNGPSGEARTDLQGINLYNLNNDNRISFDSQSGTRGFIRYNVDTAGSIYHGHIFSAGDYNSSVTDLMLIRADGKVGIGTTSPASVSRLHVVNDNGQNGTVKLGGSEDALGLVINYDQSSATTTSITSNPSYTNTSALMILRVDGDSSSTANQLVLKGDGNVGIANSNPAYKLHVEGDIGVGANNAVTARYTTSEAYKGTFRWAGLQLGNNGSNKIIAGRTNTGGVLDFYTNNTNDASDYTVTPNGTHVMRMATDGKVGIGTTSPSKKLHVHSGAISDIAIFENDNGSFVLGQTSALTSLDLPTSNAFRIRQGSSVPLTLSTDGKVGIGTSSPAQKLSIDGSGGTLAGTAAISLWDGNSGGSRRWAIANGASAAGISQIGALTFSVGNGSFTADPLTSGVEVMRIDTNGQVYFKSSTDYKIGFNDSAGTNQWWLKSYTNGDFAIHENGVGDQFTIEAGGNVGIGQTNPGAKLDVAGNIKAADQVSVNNRTAISVAHWANSSTSSTGAIKIQIPGSHGSNFSMLVLRITAYEYNSTAATVYYVSGHDWTTGWYNNGVTKIGTSNKDVSLGYDSNYDYVIVGGTSSTWIYGHVTVDVVAHPSFYSGNMDITTGWAISQVTSLSGITVQSVTNKRVLTTSDEGSGNGIDADLLDGQQGSYYQNASNLNAGTVSDARLPGTISSDITGNAATATLAQDSSLLGGQNGAYYLNYSNFTNTPTIPVTSYTNGSNDRIITSTGTSGINGEANLTFDGTNTLTIGEGTSDSTFSEIIFKVYDGDIGTAGNNTILKAPSITGAGTRTFELPDIGAGVTKNLAYFDSGNNNNRVLTANGSNGVVGEGNLTYNGTDLTITNGNVNVSSGYGIDFSATGQAAGMSSELLDDYEEGTWTPAYKGRSGSTIINPTAGSTSNTSATYTKIGNKVFFSCYMRSSGILFASTSYTLVVDNLPFVCGEYTSVHISYADQFSGDYPAGGYVESGQDYIVLNYRNTPDGDILGMNTGDLGSGSDVNDIMIAGFYTI